MKFKKLTAALSIAAFSIGLGACSQTDSAQNATSTESENAAASSDLLETIKDRGALIVGLEGTYPPYSFHDESGELKGFEVDLIKKIAEDLGVETQFVETKWDSLIAGVDVNKYDVVINNVEATDERKQKYDFTIPYANSIGKIAVPEDSDIQTVSDFSGKNAAQSVTSNFGAKAQELGATVVPVDGFAQAIDLVTSGRADATLNDWVTFEQYLAEHPDAPIRLLDEDVQVGTGSRILLPKGQKALLDALNDALSKELSAGTVSELSKQYTSIDISAEAK
ncbi:MAG: transporter substrate-binding domain-containing protein [Actinomycetaceae bacterium]|nr:transporter substrate-binding domain-containing protein [Arcanobacterium sp.]MDD7505083.1 transporter substrate-binding domain-containing protein [Actinomycetaceae bacterium]MDY6142600.1 transporter substrate-binding domain-containing protein [Arcanobacterium sp.]